MITWAQWGFQDAASPLIEEFLYFHDFLAVILSFIFWSTIYVLLKVGPPGLRTSLLRHNSGECVWTIYPAAVLFQIGIPSLTLLYMLDETTALSQVSLKAVGHQWYWSYEYRDNWSGCPIFDYNSYMLGIDTPESRGQLEPGQSKVIAVSSTPPLPEILHSGPPSLPNPLPGDSGVAVLPPEGPVQGPLPNPHPWIGGGYRLLDVDNRTTAPFGVIIRMIVRSLDVLHSWAMPSLGIKVDACPGRLNQQSFLGHRAGLFYGQCSEICGSNHRFIPIVVEFISPGSYFWWGADC